MKIPKVLKCGIHTYKIKLNRTNDEERGLQNWGKTLFTDCKILIDKDVNQTRIEETFFHELLHCCMNEVKLNNDLDNKNKEVTEEDVVARLAPILIKTLKENNIIH